MIVSNTSTSLYICSTCPNVLSYVSLGSGVTSLDLISIILPDFLRLSSSDSKSTPVSKDSLRFSLYLDNAGLLISKSNFSLQKAIIKSYGLPSSNASSTLDTSNLLLYRFSNTELLFTSFLAILVINSFNF
ncbi:hypothetical protein [Kochikohdavirus PBEF19]|uniref:Uncharacterized protein n=1 Tax=Enterococcus phage PBEF129 TaxID=2696337 RepID=A0A7T3JES5_9CAUD|nr:hypothetical protein [Enterococcus phage PBEF129]